MTSQPDRPIPVWLRPIRQMVRQWRFYLVRLRLRGKLSAGVNVTIGANSVLAIPEYIKLGNNVRIGRHFHVEANVDIGSDVLISSHVAMIGNDHRFDDPSSTVVFQGRNESATVILDGDNLIGFGSIIIGSVKIGHGCIVGAGAVVTRDLPAGTICVGIPARPVRHRAAHPDSRTFDLHETRSDSV